MNLLAFNEKLKKNALIKRNSIKMNNYFYMSLILVLLFNLVTLNNSENQLESIIDKLTGKNPNYHHLNLSSFKEISEQNRSAILSALTENRFVSSVSWHNEFNSTYFKNRIHNILFENILNYRRFPSDLIHALLSKHVNEIESHKTNKSSVLFDTNPSYRETLLDWKINQICDDLSKSGFYAVLYINDRTRQMILSFRGVDIDYLKEDVYSRILDCDNSFIKDLKSYSYQTTECLNCTDISVKIANQLGYDLSMTGYSLGAYLAELSLFHSNSKRFKAVTFESPGSREIIEQLSKSNLTYKLDIDKLNITSYLYNPSVINTLNSHVGRLFNLRNDPSNHFKKVPGRQFIDTPIEEINVRDGRLRNPNQVSYMLAWPKTTLEKLDWFRYIEYLFELTIFGEREYYYTYKNILITYKYEYTVDNESNRISKDVSSSSDDYYLFELQKIDLDEFDQSDFTIQLLKRIKELYTIDPYFITSKSRYYIDEIREIMSRAISTINSVVRFLDGKTTINKKSIKNTNGIKLNLVITNENMNRFYIDRKSLTNKLDELLRNESLVWIRGQSGMGKTTLAYKHAIDSSRYEVIRWINSDSFIKIESELLKMAEEMGFNRADFNDNTRTSIYSIIVTGINKITKGSSYFSEVLTNVSPKKKTKNVLFVFDDLIDMNDQRLVSLFDQLKQASDLKILVTTRNSSLLDLELGYFNERNRLEIGDNFIRANDIKCLDQITSPYLLSKLRVYSNLQDIESCDLLKLEKIFFNKLMNQSLEAWLILQYSSLLDSDFINLEILQIALDLSRISLNRAVNKLEELGIFSVIYHDTETIGLKLWHRNFQLDVQEFMERKKECVLKLVVTFNELLKNNEKSYVDKVLKYLINAERFERTINDLDLNNLDDQEMKNQLLQFYKIIGNIYINQGLKNEGVNYYKKLMILAENFKSPPDFAKICREVGTLFFEIAKYDEALECFFSAKKLMPSNHEEFVWLYDIIGNSFERIGKYEQSLEYFFKSLELTLPSDNSNYARLYKNIAIVYNKQGKYNESFEFYNKVLEIKEKSLPSDHPEIIQLYVDIGQNMLNLQKYDLALVSYLKLLEIGEKSSPSDYSTISGLYSTIGHIFERLGNMDKSLEYFFKSLEILNKSSTLDQNFIVMLYKNIAIVYHKQGKYNESFEFYNKVLEIKEKSLPSDHPDIIQLYVDIGQNMLCLQKYDLALVSYLKLLEIREKSTPSDYSTISGLYNNIGHIFERLGNMDKSLEYFFKSLEILNKSTVSDESFIALVNNNIGKVYTSLKEYNKSLKYFLKALDIRENTSDYLKIAETSENIGFAFEHLENYDKAFEYYYKELEARKKCLPLDYFIIYCSYNYLGLILDYQGKFNESLQSFLKSFQIVIEHLLPSNLSDNYQSFGQLDYYIEGLKFSSKFLRINERKLPLPLSNLFFSRNYNYYDSQVKYDEVLEYFLKSLQTCKYSMSSEIASLYNYIGIIYYHQRNYEMSEEFYYKSIEIRERLDDPDVVFVYYNLALLFEKQGKRDKADRFFSKSLQIKGKILLDHISISLFYNYFSLIYVFQNRTVIGSEYLFRSLEIRKNAIGLL